MPQKRWTRSSRMRSAWHFAVLEPSQVPWWKWDFKIPMECLSTGRKMRITLLCCEALNRATKASNWWMLMVHVRLFQYPGHGMRQATSRLWKYRQPNFHDSEFRNMVFQCATPAILALQISVCEVLKFKIWVFLTSQLAWEEVAQLISWHLTGFANQTYQSEKGTRVMSSLNMTKHSQLRVSPFCYQDHQSWLRGCRASLQRWGVRTSNGGWLRDATGGLFLGWHLELAPKTSL